MLRGLLVWLTALVISPFLTTLALLCHLVRPQGFYVHRIARVWCGCLVRAAGGRVVSEGREILERHRPCVVVANHTSNMDIWALIATVPDPFLLPAKASIFRIPMIGATMRAMGMVPLQRTGTQRDIREVERMTAWFERAAVLCFYPEGTRSPNGRLRTFKKGAFVTAIRHGVPVVPVAIEGAHRVQPARSWHAYPGTIRVRVLEPISTEALDYADRDELTAKAWARIAAALPDDQKPEDPVAASA